MPPERRPQTSSTQETEQNAALGNATALNPAVAVSDPTRDLTVKSAAAQEGVSGASVSAGTLTATGVGGTTIIHEDGNIESAVYDIPPTALVNVESLGLNKVEAATIGLTATKCRNSIINNYGQNAVATYTLPAAAEGLSFLFIIATTGNAAHIKAGASDKIYLNGTALDDGDKVSLATPALADCCAVWAFQTGVSDGTPGFDWYCNTIKGVWTDGGA